MLKYPKKSTQRSTHDLSQKVHRFDMLVANENIWGADLRSEYSWVPFLQSPMEQKNSSTLFFKFHFWQLPLIFMTRVAKLIIVLLAKMPLPLLSEVVLRSKSSIRVFLSAPSRVFTISQKRALSRSCTFWQNRVLNFAFSISLNSKQRFGILLKTRFSLGINCDKSILFSI